MNAFIVPAWDDLSSPFLIPLKKIDCGGTNNGQSFDLSEMCAAAHFQPNPFDVSVEYP